MFKSILAKTMPNVKLQDPIEGIAMIKKPNAKFNRKSLPLKIQHFFQNLVKS